MSDIRFNRWLHQSGTGGVYQDSSGRVGIGTSVPTSALDVQSGSIKIGSNTLSSTGVSTFSTLTATTITGVSTIGVTTVHTRSIVGVVTAGITTAYVTSINDGPLAGSRNRIINGDCRIDARNSGASVTGNDAFPVDRWKQNMSGGGVLTSNRSTVAPTGFVNSLLATVSTADASIAAADYYNLNQRIEGFNVDDLGFGTANAQTVTLSFWARSSATGTLAGCLANSAADRSYTFAYSISTANTWEYKTVTIPGDTSGTWLRDNGIGIRVAFDLGSGSDSQGTAGAWQSGFKSATAAAVKLISTLNATFYITGVQLELGTVATPFERRSYGQELALCQRYFYLHKNYMGQAAPFDNEASGAVAQSSATTIVYRAVRSHPVEMRATPIVTWSNVDFWDGGVQRSVVSINNNNSSLYTRSVDWNMNGNMTALGRPAFEFLRPSGFIACSSEL